MAKTKLTKNGVKIYVAADAVAYHKLRGWKSCPVARLAEGRLTLDDVEVTTGAAALNALGYPIVATGTLENVFLRHYQITPATISATYVHAAANLLATVQALTSGITSPDFPRTVTAKGSVSGVTGNVTVTGTNIWGEVITDTIALSGSSEVEGIKAFATVTKIDLPVEYHAHAAQVETATVVGSVTKSGNATVIVTCSGMGGTPKTLSVAVLNGDTAIVAAGKIRTALGLDADVIALFSVGGSGADVVLTKRTVAANITNLNISTDNGTCEGLTTAGTSVDTIPGVAYDTVSIGVGKKFGLPQIAYNAACMLLALFNASADTGGTLAVDDDEVEKNLYSCAGTPNGSKLLDLYYLA